MTIEEKARAYDKALKNAKEWAKNPTVWSSDDICQKLFPELLESEDEKTRKELLKFLESIWHLGKNAPLEKWDKSDCSKWIAWLEKQKYTQRDVDDAYLKGVTDTKHELEKQGEKKSTWSEEDEDKFNKVIDELTPFGECPDNPDWEQREYYHGRDAMINWLKSIKDRLKGE